MISSKPLPILTIGVAPLWELEYTGISNVVYELARRFLGDTGLQFQVRFSVFNKWVDESVIRRCLDSRSGLGLHQAFESGTGIHEIVVDEHGRIDGMPSLGLFLHTKPPTRTFSKEAHLYYDFSFLLTPECHTVDTVNFHLNELPAQIESCDLFFCISEATAGDLRWIFDIPEERVIVALLGNNVDLDHSMAARAAIGERDIEPYYLMLGTIEPRKNIALVLKWLSMNRDFLDRNRFVFAGREGWGPSFMAYVQEYDLAGAFERGRLVQVGYVDEALKATLMTGARAVLYPSIFEGFGLPVLEAMTLGVPVIASCSTSIPEVLGPCGYYFDPYSVDSFDAAMKDFIYDMATGRLARMVADAQARADLFSYDRMFAQISTALGSDLMLGAADAGGR